jgi:hypothetical protein
MGLNFGTSQDILVPKLSEQRVSCSRAQISVWKWCLKISFLSSFSEYQYKEKRQEKFKSLHFL